MLCDTKISIHLKGGVCKNDKMGDDEWSRGLDSDKERGYWREQK